VPTEVVYAPGLVVKEAVGAAVSTVIIRVEVRKLFAALLTTKLFEESLIAPEMS